MGDFDPVIHQPARLRIMAALVALEPGQEVEFTWLRDRLAFTDGNLGAHLMRLEEAEYVRVAKTFVGRRPCTYASATNKGRTAFRGHAEALSDIIAGDEATGDSCSRQSGGGRSA